MRAMMPGLLFTCLGCAAASSTPETEAEAKPEAQAEAAAIVETETEPPTLETERRCPLKDDWSACAGQEVELRGQAPQAVYQHPLLTQPEGLSPDERDSYQGYVEVEGAQIIVLTNAAFDCPGSMRVVGTLARVDLGGEPGTKGSYTGWSVSDAVVTCE